MAVNPKSGRVVIDVNPELKMALHATLAAEGLSLKQWFQQAAQTFITEYRQPPLTFGTQSSKTDD